MVEIFGTLGPGCDDEETLYKMFAEGMTGIRINVLDGAASLMVTGETAVGENPVEVIKYLSKTAGTVYG